MALEAGTYINDLVPGNPPGTDSKSQGDDHLRLIKTVLKNTFPLAVGPLKFRLDDDAANGINMTFYKKSATPAAGDYLASITVNGNNDSLAETMYGRLLWQCADPVASTGLDATLYIQTMVAGAIQNSLTCHSSGTSFFGTIYANGAGLTNLNASNIDAGTLADARLPATAANITDFRTSVIRFPAADAGLTTYIQGFYDPSAGGTIQKVVAGVEVSRAAPPGATYFGKTQGNISSPGVTIHSFAFKGSPAGFPGGGRIDSTGYDHEAMILNKVGSVTTGAVLLFYRGATNIGSITYSSASVVALNGFMGTHWSQTVDGTKPANCYQGTIVESINTICSWPSDETTETRLPKFKISDTVNSTSVIGVFSEWDVEDSLSDAYIASTGLGFVRIRSGEAVTKGDLITSYGNGCGTKQAGATATTILSSTVAKVVSNIVAETYPDGSFRVPALILC